MKYSREQYYAQIEGDDGSSKPRSYFYEMQALVSILILLQEGEFTPEKKSWPYHLQQFEDFEATTEFLDRVYRDLFPQYIKQCPDKAASTFGGYTLTPEGPVNTQHIMRWRRE